VGGFTQTIDTITRAFEFIGVGIIVVGFFISAGRAVMRIAADGYRQAYEDMRATFGRSGLLGLEVLVAADIIRTVAVDPTLENLLVLELSNTARPRVARAARPSPTRAIATC